MPSAAMRSSIAVTVPQSQNTAPVREFRCLYTHDVRRKQKRWQDGRVKFHTFNKRLMVYDDTQNFIGDSHWKEDDELQQEDEVTLDIGVLVQVGDLLHITQTDLAPLFERDRKKPGENAGSVRDPRTATRRVDNKANNSSMQRHRSLNTLLSSTKGAYGRAPIPGQSPFEARKANQENEGQGEREAKRRKVLANNTPTWTRTEDVRKRKTVHKIVDMTSETDNVPLSDVTVQSSPRPHGTLGRTSTPLVKRTELAPRIPRTRSPLRAPARISSPPVSTKNQVRHVEVDFIINSTPPLAEETAINQTPSLPKTKHFRFAKSQQRSKLLCQKTLGLADSEPKETPAMKRRPNLYQTLSDIEDEATAEEVRPVPKKKKSASLLEGDKVLVDLTNDPSSSAAFNADPSCSPRLGTREARKSEVSNRKYDDDAQGKLGQGVRGLPKVMRKGITSKERLPAVEIEQDEREDSAIALAETAQVTTAIKKGPSEHGRTATTKSSNKASRRQQIDRVANDVHLAEALKKEPDPEPKEKEQGPWTVEATELFDWRPPDWKQRLKRMQVQA